MASLSRRQLLHVGSAGLISRVFWKSTIAHADIRARLGCAVRSDQLTQFRAEIVNLPVIEIEDWLDPMFPERADAVLPAVQRNLAGYRGKILLSGPFIDLNPGSAERLIQDATRRRFEECWHFAKSIHATEIIFLSSYLPLIKLPVYDAGWLQHSVAFWNTFLNAIDRNVTISLCNTFEYHPDLMVRVVEEVHRPQFRLALDIGHFLVYAQESLTSWLNKSAPYLSSVYVHSNDGQIDSHDEVGRGVLSCAQIRQIASALPSANLILKMKKKDRIGDNLRWTEAC